MASRSARRARTGPGPRFPADPSTPVGGDALPPDTPAPTPPSDPAPAPADPAPAPADPAPAPDSAPPVVSAPAPADPVPPDVTTPAPGDDGGSDDKPTHPKPADPVASDPTPADTPAADGPASRPAVPVLAPASQVVRVATVVSLPVPVTAAATGTATVASVHGSYRPLVAPRVRTATPRALLAAAASAGLLPFAPRDARDARGPSAMHPDLDAIVAGTPARGTVAAPAAGAPDAAHRVPDTRSHRGGGNTPPRPPGPFGPPGNAGAGGAAGASSGAASGVWCALLIGGLVLLVQSLRRYRFRLVVPAPRGVVLLLQRPG